MRMEIEQKQQAFESQQADQMQGAEAQQQQAEQSAMMQQQQQQQAAEQANAQMQHQHRQNVLDNQKTSAMSSALFEVGSQVARKQLKKKRKKEASYLPSNFRSVIIKLAIDLNPPPKFQLKTPQLGSSLGRGGISPAVSPPTTSVVPASRPKLDTSNPWSSSGPKTKRTIDTQNPYEPKSTTPPVPKIDSMEQVYG